MSPRRLSALATVPALLAGPAGAEPIIPIPMQVHVSHTATAFYACGEGVGKSATNVWVLRVKGVRAATTQPANAVINETYVSFQPTFDHCITIPKLGTVAGSIAVTFTYAGSGPDIAGTFGGWGVWAPSQPDQSGDTGVGAFAVTDP